jgi:glutathione S-transferase
MKLYEFGPTRSLRVRWTLQEIGAPFESIVVNLTQGAHRGPAYLMLNPAGKLPTLIDGDLVLTESAAIVLYLAEKYPEKRLLPEPLRARAEHNRWLLFTVTELEQPLWRIARHTFLYPEEQRIEADAAIARREFREMAAVIEAHMRGRDFVVGDHVTVADFVLAYTLDWANEEALLDQAPTLLAYMERMYRRPHAAPRIAQALAAASGG